MNSDSLGFVVDFIAMNYPALSKNPVGEGSY